MGLRHTHAVRRLLAGENIRAVQESLGHRSIETTLRYQACLPQPVTSPADPAGPAQVIAEMTNLLHRLAVAFPAATPAASSGGPEAAPVTDTKARPSAVAPTTPLQPAFAQGP